jgi:hypothetical protein
MTSEEFRQEAKRRKARELRFKRPALASMGWEFLQGELDDIISACSDIRWAEDVTGGVFDGDEDERLGFEMDFGDLCDSAERLQAALEQLTDYGEEPELYDDCTVALIGDRYRCLGFDEIEEDYFSLTAYEAELAKRESGKRLMRLTKEKMISTIGQCMGILLAFYDLRMRFDTMKAALGVLTETNLETLRAVNGIEDAYEAWNDDGAHPWGESFYALDRRLRELPEICWIA